MSFVYIGALVVPLLAAGVWRYRQRDIVGMGACPPMAGLGACALVLPPR